MVCNHCWYRLIDGDHLNTIRLLGEERAYARNMRDEVNRLSGEIKRQTIQKPKKYPYSNPWSAVPPKHILTNAVNALHIEGRYNSFPEVLCDYYGIESPPFIDDSSMVPKKAIACYYPSTNHVYSRGSMSHHTAFHEIYHVLERHGIVPETADGEKNANFYADACDALLKQKI
jgi:hypothetical protein